MSRTIPDGMVIRESVERGVARKFRNRSRRLARIIHGDRQFCPDAVVAGLGRLGPVRLWG